jgi:hypothetical protein
LAAIAPATAEFVAELATIAGQIGSTVLSNRKGQVEKDREDFYKRARKYHARLREMLEDKDKSPRRLADDLARDDLFSFVAGNDNAEEISRALRFAEGLRRHDRAAVLRAVIRVLERVTVTSFQKD